MSKVKVLREAKVRLPNMRSSAAAYQIGNVVICGPYKDTFLRGGIAYSSVSITMSDAITVESAEELLQDLKFAITIASKLDSEAGL